MITAQNQSVAIVTPSGRIDVVVLQRIGNIGQRCQGVQEKLDGRADTVCRDLGSATSRQPH